VNNRLPVLAVLLAAAATPLLAQVKAVEEDVTMPTWQIGPPQVHSVFYDAPGRSGEKSIYPYTLNEVLTDRRADKTYHAVTLENEYVRIMVLPEIGGRLHGALDKTNGYVFLYWQKTVKPGLISMTGAWISGGIEWNFPHGHRPSGFSTVDHRLVHNADGSATVWVGETEPIFRMRWLVGMTVFPHRSYVRCDYVFENPTNERNQFQFWATASTHANEFAQAQYPGDMVTGHGKHEFWNWPVHDGVDLTWWKNVPNASSFFAFNNPSDWFGTYDHRAQGGMVHVADHRDMPGKKLWTWGSGPSGRIWEDILSDGGGAYFEPQAGAWSDNQPDLHWLEPHQVLRTHDFWYPVRNSRGYHNANSDFAVNTDLRDGKAFAAVNSTAPVKDYKVVLRDVKNGTVLSEKVTAIAPDKPYTVELPAPAGASVYDFELSVYDPQGSLAIAVKQNAPRKVDLPEGMRDPGDPKKMNPDELYHAGEWLDKFVRTNQARTYYEEALRRDPQDSRVNLELGTLASKQGLWEEALRYFRTAERRDVENSRLRFGKAVALVGLARYKEAYDEFHLATGSPAEAGAAWLNLARLDLRARDHRGAVERAGEAERRNGGFPDAPATAAAAWRLVGDSQQALAAAERALALDAMHFMGGYEKLLALEKSGGAAAAEWGKTWRGVMRDDTQNYLELAVSYGSAGLYGDADAVLAKFSQGKQDAQLHPMVNYLRGYFKDLAGDRAAAAPFYAKAKLGPVDYTNPHRLEEKDALEAALRQDPRDAHAHLFLGNLLYAKERRDEGFAHWQQAAALDANLTNAWRNVAYAQRFLKKDLAASYETYQKVLAKSPADARVILELDQVAQALGRPGKERFATLEAHLEAVNTRDDLVARLVDLRLEQGDRHNLELAQATLKEHHFRSWEGQYGIHHGWIEANQRMGDLALAAKQYTTALDYYKLAAEYPKNLEVAARTPDFRASIDWNFAKLALAQGDRAAAAEPLKRMLAEQYTKPHLGTYYQALAQKALGNDAGYRSLLDSLEKRARELTNGAYENRGAPEVLGHYLLSLVLEQKGNQAEADAERAKALRANPRVARQALTEAQIDVARASQ
jgi:Tfp pilus assembly protein PilF